MVRFLIVSFIGLLILFAGLNPASAANSESTDSTYVSQVSIYNVHIGDLLDVHNESLLRSTLKKADKEGADLIIVQIDAHGVAGADIDALISDIKNTRAIVAMWVGPTGASYSSELNNLVHSADVVGAASKQLAKKVGTDIVAPSLREFIAAIDNKTIDGLTLSTGCSKAETQSKDSGERYEECKDVELKSPEKFVLNVTMKFEKLNPISNLGHALINPSFAIGILVLGLCLLVFEFYAASVGVAAIAGIGGVISGIYGLGYLPTQWWAVALVVFGVFAMVVDVQAGGVGLYTIVGTPLLALGTFFATERHDAYGVSIAATIIITIMALLFMLGAIPSLIRTRFGTPTIGREDFIGEEGIADGDINPEGKVKLRGASWKARTNHATPIKDGEKCKVVKIEGIILEVEPLVGAAVDYREKHQK